MNSPETRTIDRRCTQAVQSSPVFGVEILVVLMVSAIAGSFVFAQSNSFEWMVIAVAVASIIVSSVLVIGHQFNYLLNS